MPEIPEPQTYFEVKVVHDEIHSSWSGLSEEEAKMMYEFLMDNHEVYSFLKDVLDVVHNEIKNQIRNN